MPSYSGILALLTLVSAALCCQAHGGDAKSVIDVAVRLAFMFLFDMNIIGQTVMNIFVNELSNFVFRINFPHVAPFFIPL